MNSISLSRFVLLIFAILFVVGSTPPQVLAVPSSPSQPSASQASSDSSKQEESPAVERRTEVIDLQGLDAEKVVFALQRLVENPKYKIVSYQHQGKSAVIISGTSAEIVLTREIIGKLEDLSGPVVGQSGQGVHGKSMIPVASKKVDSYRFVAGSYVLDKIESALGGLSAFNFDFLELHLGLDDNKVSMLKFNVRSAQQATKVRRKLGEQLGVSVGSSSKLLKAGFYEVSFSFKLDSKMVPKEMIRSGASKPRSIDAYGLALEELNRIEGGELLASYANSRPARHNKLGYVVIEVDRAPIAKVKYYVQRMEMRHRGIHLAALKLSPTVGDSKSSEWQTRFHFVNP